MGHALIPLCGPSLPPPWRPPPLLLLSLPRLRSAGGGGAAAVPIRRGAPTLRAKRRVVACLTRPNHPKQRMTATKERTTELPTSMRG